MKKGFTLVELLAVIVILAVLLVIAVPRIEEILNSNKENAFISSAKLIISEAERKYIENNVLNENEAISCSDIVDMTSDYEDCTLSFDSDGTANLSINGLNKFDGLSICDVTKNNIEISNTTCLTYTDESCFAFSDGEIKGYNVECGTEVVIPSMIGGINVTSIGEYAFTSNGEAVSNVSNNNNDYKFDNMIYAGKKAKIVTLAPTPSAPRYQGMGITKVVLPEGLLSLKEGPFYNNNLSDIIIPSTVTLIGYFAIDSHIKPLTIHNLTGRSFDWGMITGLDFYESFIYDTPSNNLNRYNVYILNN